MAIREATLNDVPSILRVRRLAFDNELETKLTEAMLSKALRGPCKAYVAEVRDEIVGFVMANKKTKTIWGLFVFEPFQGQGFGKTLLSRAVDWLWQQRVGLLKSKIQKITLTTKAGSKAEQFYSSCGWQRGRMLTNQEVEYVLTRSKT